MFGTSYVGFGSDPTYTQKIMKIPDIAWPTFFDSYRESMLRSMFCLFLSGRLRQVLLYHKIMAQNFFQQKLSRSAHLFKIQYYRITSYIRFLVVAVFD